MLNTNFLKSASSLKRSSSESLLPSCRYSAENRALLSRVPEASLNTGLWNRTERLNIEIDGKHTHRREQNFPAGSGSPGRPCERHPVLAQSAAGQLGILQDLLSNLWKENTQCSPGALKRCFINSELGRQYVPGWYVKVWVGIAV